METKSENLDEPVVFHRTTLKKKKEEEKQEGEEKEAKSWDERGSRVGNNRW